MKYIYTACFIFMSTIMWAQNPSFVPKCVFKHSNMLEAINSIATDMYDKRYNTYALRFYKSGQTDKMEIKAADAAVLLDSASRKTVIYMNEYLPDTIVGILATRKHFILILGEYSCNYIMQDLKGLPSYYIIPYHREVTICAPYIDDREFTQRRKVYKVKLPQLIQTFPMRIMDDLR